MIVARQGRPRAAVGTLFGCLLREMPVLEAQALRVVDTMMNLN